ncbi:PTS system mannose/fructose/sorbose family transporter subunit IID [Endozoicomonas lisbonensis]|uniref:PTS system N-acetylgalactosamine-specific IID component n=1 Tax=Endozoicomonas lisbonensis TaxID=3120522 RepID=A0ABV2SB28_9GAMM
MAFESTLEMDAKAERMLAKAEATSTVVADEYEDQAPAAELTRKDITRMAWRSLALQASFNYERMQAAGWLYGLIPSLRKIHKNDEDLSRSMKLHMEFYNTHPFLVTFIMGIVLAMEKSKERLSVIRAIKVATMGPMGGIGDALFWLTLLPICAALGISLAMEGSLAGPVLFLVLFNAVHFGLRFGLAHYGYSAGTKAISALKEHTQKLSHAATIVGLTVVGGLIATFVNLNTTLVLEVGQATVALQQDLFDPIMPKLLPLVFTLGVFSFIKRGVSPLKVIGGIVVLGITGAYLGFL